MTSCRKNNRTGISIRAILRISTVALAMLLVASVAGCRVAVTPADLVSESSSGQGIRTFTDSCGRMVEIPETITRIAPSGTMAQMMLYSLAPEHMVGWSMRPADAVMHYFPVRFRSLPEFGQFYGTGSSLNLEALIAVQPQVILDIGDQKPTHRADMDGIQEQTGIPTLFIEANLDTFPAAYRTIGELLGVESRAEQLAVYIGDTVAMARRSARRIPSEDRLSVMFGTGTTGLDVNARGSIHADVIELVGAVNAIVVPEVSFKGGGNTISMEEVLNADPDVLLFSPGGPFATLDSDVLWQGLDAVKNDRFYEIPKGPYNWLSDPPSVNRILGIRWLGNLLYPEIYAYDIAEEAKRFYRLFWHYELSDEEVRVLLAGSSGKAR
jgi:iron complex transport system substrate-binding protein